MLPFPRVMSAFWHSFSKVSGSASCHVLAPFFKGFRKCPKRHVNFSQKLINVCTSLPFFKGVLLIGFPKFPFPRFASLSPMLPFSKGGSIVHQKILWCFAETFLWSIPKCRSAFYFGATFRLRSSNPLRI